MMPDQCFYYILQYYRLQTTDYRAGHRHLLAELGTATYWRRGKARRRANLSNLWLLNKHRRFYIRGASALG